MTIDKIEKFRKQCNDFLDTLIKEQFCDQTLQEGDIVTIRGDLTVGIVIKIQEYSCVLWIDKNIPVITLKSEIIKTDRHCSDWQKYRKKAEEYYEA